MSLVYTDAYCRAVQMQTCMKAKTGFPSFYVLYWGRFVKRAKASQSARLSAQVLVIW